jgi:DNA adenine methylase
VTVANYRRQRAILRRAAQVDTATLGFAALFVNRTSRSGIIGPRAGVIGGLSQTGEWKVNARFGRDGLVERIEEIARRRRQIRVYNTDAVRFLTSTVASLPSHTFVYLDPPYYSNGQRLYANYYKHADHVQVASAVHKLDQSWVLSYDDVPEIRRLYQSYPMTAYSIDYSAADRYRGREILFSSHGLRTPAIVDPGRFNDTALRLWLLHSQSARRKTWGVQTPNPVTPGKLR